MDINDNIGWLKSLKQQIGQSQHPDLWQFEKIIDETIDNLRPLAVPHGRLIDADALIADLQGLRELFPSSNIDYFGGVISLIKNSPAIIEAEMNELDNC